MDAHSNTTIIQDHFAALGRGDLPAALSCVAEEVSWRSPATTRPPEEFRWAGERTSRAAVAAFFQALAETVELGHLELREITAEGNRVVIEGSNAGTVRSTGKSYEHEWIMVFTLRNGRITQLRHYYDPAEIVEAFRTSQPEERPESIVAPVRV